VNKYIIFINDWGSNPNERIFYIADFIKQETELTTLIIGRKYKGIPERNDLFLISSRFLNKERSNNSRIKKSILRLLILLMSIWKVIKLKPSYLYIRSRYFSFVFGKLKKIFKYKLIYETHGLAYKEQQFKGRNKKARLTKRLENSIFNKLADYIVTNTSFLADRINNEYNFIGKIFTIPNAIDLSDFHKIEKLNIQKDVNEFWAGFVGNWESWIAIEDLLKVSELTDRIKIVVIGEGYQYKELKAQFSKVRFTGRVEKQLALSYLKHLDCCISPWSSDPIFQEKSARKTYEYLAAGKPIIISNVAGKEEFIKENENCLLYEPGNSDSLLSAIIRLKKSKSLSDKLSRNNKLLAKEYTWDKVIERSNLNNIFNSSK